VPWRGDLPATAAQRDDQQRGAGRRQAVSAGQDRPQHDCSMPASGWPSASVLITVPVAIRAAMPALECWQRPATGHAAGCLAVSRRGRHPADLGPRGDMLLARTRRPGCVTAAAFRRFTGGGSQHARGRARLDRREAAPPKGDKRCLVRCTNRRLRRDGSATRGSRVWRVLVSTEGMYGSSTAQNAPRPAAADFIGTFVLVFAGTAEAAAALKLTIAETPGRGTGRRRRCQPGTHARPEDRRGEMQGHLGLHPRTGPPGRARRAALRQISGDAEESGTGEADRGDMHPVASSLCPGHIGVITCP
jgi:hypothetical protein